MAARPIRFASPHRNELGRLKLVLVIVEIQFVGLTLWQRPWRAIGHGPGGQ
jgi:hypothetical protein